MDRIFWAQNENPDTPNTLIDNKGKILSLDSSEDYGNQLFDKLLSYQETSTPEYSSGNLSIKKHQNGGVFISSNFSDKDDSGRKMGFMFFTRNTSKNEIIKDLLFFSGLVKRTLVDQDLKDIDKKLNKKNYRIIKLIAAAIAVLIIYVVWKELN